MMDRISIIRLLQTREEWDGGEVFVLELLLCHFSFSQWGRQLVILSERKTSQYFILFMTTLRKNRFPRKLPTIQCRLFYSTIGYLKNVNSIISELQYNSCFMRARKFVFHIKRRTMTEGVWEYSVRIFTCDQANRKWREPHNAELHDLHFSLNIIK